MPDHRETWAAPPKGWPTFGPDGKIVRDEEEKEDDDE